MEQDPPINSSGEEEEAEDQVEQLELFKGDVVYCSGELVGQVKNEIAMV